MHSWKLKFFGFPCSCRRVRDTWAEVFVGLMEKWSNKGKKHGMGLFYALPVPLLPDWNLVLRAGLQQPYWAEEYPWGWKPSAVDDGAGTKWCLDLWWVMPWNCHTCSEPHMSHSFYMKTHLGHCYFPSSLLAANALSNWHTLYHIQKILKLGDSF